MPSCFLAIPLSSKFAKCIKDWGTVTCHVSLEGAHIADSTDIPHVPVPRCYGNFLSTNPNICLFTVEMEALKTVLLSPVPIKIHSLSCTSEITALISLILFNPADSYTLLLEEKQWYM